MCNKKVTTGSVDGLRNFKALSKAKLEPRKGHSHCLVVCCWVDTLQLSESQQNHFIWEVCSANRWDALKTAKPAASIGQQKGLNSSPQQCPIAHHTTNASKAERTGLQSFASSAILTWPLTHQLQLLQVSHNCLQGKCVHNPQEAENAFKSSWNPEAWIFTLQE